MISTTFFGSTFCHLWTLKILFTPAWGRDGLSRHKIIRLLPFLSENRCCMSLASGNGARSSKRIGSSSWNAIWSLLFKARKDVGQDVDSENLLTCFSLHWKCTFRLLIQALKRELAEFASVEGLKWLLTDFCKRNSPLVGRGLKECLFLVGHTLSHSKILFWKGLFFYGTICGPLNSFFL